MTDEAEKTGDNGGEGSDKFDPESLSAEGQEYLKRTIQSESARKTGLATKKLQDESAAKVRSDAEVAEQNEQHKLAESGDLEGLGARVRDQLVKNRVEDSAIIEFANTTTQAMSEQFSESLGAEKVEEIRLKVVETGGAHAEFAQELAKATAEKAHGEDLEAEFNAFLVKKGLLKREEVGGADKVLDTGQGRKPSTADEIEAAYGRGEVSIEVYEESQKNR